MKKNAIPVRWSIDCNVVNKSRELAKAKGVGIGPLVEYLLRRECAQEQGQEAPPAPWDKDVVAQDGAQEVLNGERYKRYLSKSGKKFSLAWDVVDDPDFIKEINDRWHEEIIMNGITPKWLTAWIEKAKVERPEQFSKPFGSTTLAHIFGVLMDRGNIIRVKRGTYRVVVGWTDDPERMAQIKSTMIVTPKGVYYDEYQAHANQLVSATKAREEAALASDLPNMDDDGYEYDDPNRELTPEQKAESARLMAELEAMTEEEKDAIFHANDEVKPAAAGKVKAEAVADEREWELKDINVGDEVTLALKDKSEHRARCVEALSRTSKTPTFRLVDDPDAALLKRGDYVVTKWPGE